MEKDQRTDDESDTADTSKVTTSAILGQRGKLIGRTADACFDLFSSLELLRDLWIAKIVFVDR